MNRKLAAGVAAIAVAMIATWFLVLRHRGETPKKPASPPTATAKVEPKLPTPKPQNDTPAPRGMAPRWALDADREGPLRLEGQVVDADGQGVGGAKVWLSSVPPRSATTEDDGSFAFDKLVGRSYSLGASKGDMIGGPITSRLTTTSDPVVIRIAEGAALAVTVVDDQGQPVAGASVKAGEAEQDAKTDDQGKVTVKPVRPGWAMVAVSASGYAEASAFTTVGSAGATAEVKVTLHRGAAVSGRVVDEAGKPIAKARISSSDGSPWGFGREAGTVTSDDKGRFELAALAPGTHVLQAIDGEHAPASSTPITVAADRPVSGIQITMQAGGVVKGKVVDGDGKPAAFATVRVAGTGARMWMVAARQTTCDQHGAFELRGLSRAKLQARAESDTAASKLADIDLTAKPVTADLQLVLDVKGTIAGTVVDDQGQPVPEVQVNAMPDLLGGGSTEGFALAGMSSATTDGAGGFSIHGLPDGPYRLWAGRTGSGMNMGWGNQSVSARTGDTKVRIVLAAGGELVGRIALENGTPPALAQVQVGQRPPTPATDGAFAIKDLQPGTYDLRLHGPEFTETIRHDVVVSPGKKTDLGTITVTRGRKLTGRVVDASGAPVAGARVKLGQMLFSMSGADDERAANMEEMAGIRSAVTDQDGAFTVIGVPPKATYVMAAHPDRGQSLAAAVPEGTDDPPPVTLALRGYGSITGKVTIKGQPAGGVTISDSSKGGGAQAVFAQTADDGSFTMTKVPEGTHVLTAMQTQMMAMKSTSVNVKVTAGRATNVTIDIPVGSIKLTVQLKPLPGNQVDAAQVFLLHGTAAPQNGKQLTEGFFQGGVQGMKFWFGTGKPSPEFDELVPGDYSICSIPITGDLSDGQLQQRLQENMQTLKVYCKQVAVAASPNQQTAVQELPAMTPLPTPKN